MDVTHALTNFLIEIASVYLGLRWNYYQNYGFNGSRPLSTKSIILIYSHPFVRAAFKKPRNFWHYSVFEDSRFVQMFSVFSCLNLSRWGHNWVPWNCCTKKEGSYLRRHNFWTWQENCERNCRNACLHMNIWLCCCYVAGTLTWGIWYPILKIDDRK